MSGRIVLARWTPGDQRGERAAREGLERLRAAHGWTEVLDRRGVVLWRSSAPIGDCTLILPDDMGAIFGVLFAKNAGASTLMSTEKLTSAEALAWTQDGGASLLQRHWGNYLAVLHDRGVDKLFVLRDPAGSWPVFWGEHSQVVWVFTHADDYIAANAGALELDRLSLQLFLAQSRLPTARTTISGVSELLPGQRLTLARASVHVETAWRPQCRGPMLGRSDGDRARETLRAILRDCASAWASVGPVVHRLSGGLDSSVALAALCAGSKDANHVTCINERPKNVPEGDEAPYARLVAAHFGAFLIEIEQAAEDVDYAKVLNIGCSAKPSITELSFGASGFVDAARATGARVLTSGQGGDQMFQRGGAHLFPLEALGGGDPLRVVMTRMVEAAQVSRRSVWNIMASMGAALTPGFSAQCGAIGANGFWALKLEDEVAAENLRHPWAQDAARATPARAYLIRQLADIPYYHRLSQTASAFIQAPFLASQPVAECVLAMPSSFHAFGGVDRALVRAAFARDLPEAIVRRRNKGDTTRHFARVVAKNWPFMRALLLGGALVRAALLDPQRLERALDRPTITDAHQLSALLNALVAEAWLRRFQAACAKAAQAARAAQGETKHPAP